MVTRSRLISLSKLFLILSLILGACAQGQLPETGEQQVPDTGGEEQLPETGEQVTEAAPEEPAAATQEAGAGEGPPTIIRFVFAPDPLIKYMQDTGIVLKHEEACNIRVQTISTWDEVAFFGGGHADIASTGDYEIPALVEETGQDLVTFGIYNLSRVPIFVHTDSPYQTIQDLQGQRIGVPGPLSSTMIWGVMLAQTEGVDFRVGGGDYDLVVNEHVVNAELLRRGEIEAGIIVPEALIPELREGSVRLLYDAGSGWEYYREHLDPDQTHRGVPSNVFLARREWYEQNQEAARCFLAMWEEGLKAWQANREDLIRLYPEDWGLDTESETFDEDVQVMVDWLTEHDWFVDTVYLDQEWIDKEMPLFDYMRESGFMDAGMQNPEFIIAEPMVVE